MLYPNVSSPDESEVGKWRQQTKNFIHSIRSNRFHVLTPFSTGNDAGKTEFWKLVVPTAKVFDFVLLKCDGRFVSRQIVQCITPFDPSCESNRSHSKSSSHNFWNFKLSLFVTCFAFFSLDVSLSKCFLFKSNFPVFIHACIAIFHRHPSRPFMNCILIGWYLWIKLARPINA